MPIRDWSLQIVVDESENDWNSNPPAYPGKDNAKHLVSKPHMKRDHPRFYQEREISKETLQVRMMGIKGYTKGLEMILGYAKGWGTTRFLKEWLAGTQGRIGRLSWVY